VAQRRRGTDAHPYAVVTSDFAELRDALAPPRRRADEGS
jgi:hypothetical protein